MRKRPKIVTFTETVARSERAEPWDKTSFRRSFIYSHVDLTKPPPRHVEIRRGYLDAKPEDEMAGG